VYFLRPIQGGTTLMQIQILSKLVGIDLSDDKTVRCDEAFMV